MRLPNLIGCSEHEQWKEESKENRDTTSKKCFAIGELENLFHIQSDIRGLIFNGLVFKLENLFIHEIDDYTCQAIHNIWLSLNLIRMKSAYFYLSRAPSEWKNNEIEKGLVKWGKVFIMYLYFGLDL